MSDVRQATSWSQDQTDELRVFHNNLGRTIEQHVG